MARRRHRSHTRDELSSLVHPVLRLPTIRLTPPVDLRLLEDRRRADETTDFARPARAMRRGDAQLVVPARSSNVRRSAVYDLPSAVQFKVPNQVAICVRRKRRKEVLHALRRTGRGARRRKAKWSEFSSVRC